MKLPNLISKVLQKSAPMTPAELNDISTKMEVWFDQKKEAVREKESLGKEPLTLFDKFFKVIDEWYLRVFFAIAFIWLTRMIQEWMNPGDEEDLHDFEEVPPRR